MIEYKLHTDTNFQYYRKDDFKNGIFLTGLIMVKNQEKNVVKAIKSIQRYCDLIVIVDTGSTDNTVPNIKKLSLDKIKIYQLNWIEDYAYMRNECLSLIPDGWTLVLDSDEEFDNTICGALELKSFLASIDTKINPVCTVKTINYDDTAFTRKSILFRKSSQIKYHGLVHEELVSTNNTKLTTIDTNMRVINKGVAVAEIKKFRKPERYSRLLIEQMNLEPDNPRWLAMVSQDYVDMGLISKDQYIEKLQKFIFKNRINDFSINNIQLNDWSKYLLARYILALFSLDDFDNASSCAKAAMELFPYDVNFLTLYATAINAINSVRASKVIDYISLYLKQSSQNWIQIMEESQGTQESIKPILSKLLISIGEYDKASKILSQIDNPKIKNMVYNELRYFE